MIEEEAINKFEIKNEFLHICNIASIKKYCVQIPCFCREPQTKALIYYFISGIKKNYKDYDNAKYIEVTNSADVYKNFKDILHLLTDEAISVKLTESLINADYNLAEKYFSHEVSKSNVGDTKIPFYLAIFKQFYQISNYQKGFMFNKFFSFEVIKENLLLNNNIPNKLNLFLKDLKV